MAGLEKQIGNGVNGESRLRYLRSTNKNNTNPLSTKPDHRLPQEKFLDDLDQLVEDGKISIADDTYRRLRQIIEGR